MGKNYISIAKEIIEKNDLSKYIDMLLNYWAENPPTLGHGFAHVLKVAVEGYEIGILNNYQNPSFIFIGGLFHDVYRPAEGRDGDEDQYLSLMITVDLFYKNKVPSEIATKVLHAIESHDNWRDKENVPLFDLLLSVADKTAIYDVVYPYAWASNKYSIERIGKPIYTNHLKLLYGFVKYQVRAWEVNMKHKVIGNEAAIKAYIDVYSLISNNYQEDPEGKNFFKYLDEKAFEFKKNEREFLEAFTNDKDKIEKIMKLSI